MSGRIIVNESDLSKFAEEFRSRGNSVDLAYLRQSRVRAFYDKKGEMTGGYAVNLKRPLRYEQWIPESLRNGVRIFGNTLSVGEITCIWIAGKRGRISSEWIYLRAVLDALMSGARYILGGTLLPVVFGIQTQSLPEVLYSGYTDYFGERRTCWIYGAPRNLLIMKILITFPLRMAESLTGRQTYLSKARRTARQLRDGSA